MCRSTCMFLHAIVFMFRERGDSMRALGFGAMGLGVLGLGVIDLLVSLPKYSIFPVNTRAHGVISSVLETTAILCVNLYWNVV